MTSSEGVARTDETSRAKPERMREQAARAIDYLSDVWSSEGARRYAENLAHAALNAADEIDRLLAELAKAQQENDRLSEHIETVERDKVADLFRKIGVLRAKGKEQYDEIVRLSDLHDSMCVAAAAYRTDLEAANRTIDQLDSCDCPHAPDGTCEGPRLIEALSAEVTSLRAASNAAIAEFGKALAEARTALEAVRAMHVERVGKDPATLKRRSWCANLQHPSFTPWPCETAKALGSFGASRPTPAPEASDEGCLGCAHRAHETPCERSHLDPFNGSPVTCGCDTLATRPTESGAGE